jgi:phosphatidylglycerol:prolipoprotein diacylglycerol transferase
VQLYEVITSLAILAVLLWRLPRRAQDGELAGAWLFLYGVAGFFLDFYRAVPQNTLILRQLGFALMVILSAPLLLRRKYGRYTEMDDSSPI